MISPLLANIYLHYALDLWAARWRRRTATGDMIIVRYADDFIVGFQHESDAQRFLNEMRDRLREFALSLHPEKTRLIEFGRFASERRQRRGLGKPETFNFLGFTFICGKTRAEHFRFNRKPERTACGQSCGRSSRSCDGVRTSRSPRRGDGWSRLFAVIFNYHAVPTNWPGTRGVPASRHQSLAAHAAATQSEGWYDVGPDDAVGGRLAS